MDYKAPASVSLCEVAGNLESPRRGAVAVALRRSCSDQIEKVQKDKRHTTVCLKDARHHGSTPNQLR